MRKSILLSLIASSLVMAETVELNEVSVEAEINSVKINDLSGEELKSADLADSLMRSVPSITVVRRSGIANDIILRGQKKDNINILMDGTKTYGACVNRMDPPTSHILTNNIESVKVTEGPFDVENMGTLSGLVEVKTKRPVEEFSGEVNLNAGSWNYKKIAATVSAGYDKFRLLLSASKESSDQYKDGDGNTFADQIDNYIANSTATGPALVALQGTAFQDQYREMKAYDKKSFMAKVYFNPTDNQELRISYTANRSDDVLYPSSKMDAMYDDSNIYNFEYVIHNLGSLSKQLDFQVYHSDVDHPMSTRYRVASAVPGERVNHLTTDMDGAKLKNMLELGSAELTIGLDASRRNWDGRYYGAGLPAMAPEKSLDDVDTDNMAIFTKYEQSFGAFDVEMGVRYDDTQISTGTGSAQDNDYSSLSAYAFTTYNADAGMEYFVGAGKSVRVPDARELYFVNAMNGQTGTPTLDQVKNYEIDLGFKKQYAGGFVKTKIFYSWLKDYIYYNSDKTVNAFENIDATIYGISLNGSHTLNDVTYVDYGIAYQRGQKDDALNGQSDKDLAEIPPLKLNVALNYDTDMTSSKVELIAADRWSKYDEDNGEQAISGYAVVNLKWNRDLTNGFDITLGMDNIFDHTYAVTNTYQDLTLLTSGGAGDEIILLNEPGRYVYINARYKF